MTVVTDYTALLSGSYWNGIEATGSPVIVTYSFSATLSPADAAIQGFTPATDASFTPFTASEQAQARQALGEWAAASGLTFLEVAPGQGDIAFQNIDFNTTSGPSYAGAGGIGFYPFGDWNFFSYPSFQGDLDSSGDVFMNSRFQNPDGTVAYGTLLHEIGHAIGLKHPTETVTDFAASPGPVVHDQVLSSDDPSRTIMATVGDPNATGMPHLHQLDKDAAAAIYGAAGAGGVYTGSASGSNALESWSWNASTNTVTQTALTVGATIRGTSVNDVINGSTGDDRLFGLAGTNTLNGGDGNDKLFGGTGTNTLIGGKGDDTYYVNSVNTTIVENPNEGLDTVDSTVSYTLPANVEVLSLFGSGLTGTGNNEGDRIFGDGTFATTLMGGTGADFMVGGAGNDTLIGGGGGDTMYGGGGTNTFVFRSVNDALPGGNLTFIGDLKDGQDKIDLSRILTPGGQHLTFIGTGMFTHRAGQVHQVTAQSGDTIVEGDVNGDGTADFQIQLAGAHTLTAANVVTCYARGTRLLTARGLVPVEALTIGDDMITVSGETSPVIWLGHRHIDCARHPETSLVWPVRIRAGAFAPAIPHRDLFLSPDHAVFADGVLIPVKHLINGTTIAQVKVAAVTYYHVELPRHAVLLAEGLAAESYLDTGNRGLFANGGGPVDLHPAFDVPSAWPEDAAAPLACDEARVRPVWERLAARAAGLGFSARRPEMTGDPGVRLVVDGRTIRPVVSEPDGCMFVIPNDSGRGRLTSLTFLPTDIRPWADDWRRLGLYITRIVWHDGNGPRDLPLDHPGLDEGWWDMERPDRMFSRWTNGDARLPALPGVKMIEVRWDTGTRWRVSGVSQAARAAKAA